MLVTSLTGTHVYPILFRRFSTFLQLKPRLMNILMNALQVETDAQNTHMLLGGLLLCVQDAVTFEETEVSLTEHMSAGESGQHHEDNILSSGECTI